MKKENYFIMQFVYQQELAAFIAAFSRFLNYPRGTVYMESPNKVKVWLKNNCFELVINNLAKQAIIKEFGQFHCIPLSSENFPNQEYNLVIGEGRVTAMGLTEAEFF